MQKSNLPFGMLSGVAREELNEKFVHLQFTFNQVWEGLDPEIRQTFVDAYPTRARAKEAFFQAIRAIPGAEPVEKKRGNGNSIWAWHPVHLQPDVDINTDGTSRKVGDTILMTVVGFTSDGEALWRRDDTDALGWVEWKEL